MQTYGASEKTGTKKKRVMAVVDRTSQSKHAMIWTLTHLANDGDLLTLLHVVSSSTDLSESPSRSSSDLANSLGYLCKAARPEVEVEALVIQGPKLETVLAQVKKLEVSVLVVGLKSPSFLSCFGGARSSEEFAEQCINQSECWTVAVRKQTNGMGGYLINTRWHNNFWLLA